MDETITARGPAPADDLSSDAVLIRLEDAAFRVGGRTLLHHTNWEIRRGQNWAVLGPNGAGKSTLLGALTGKTPVVAGRLHRLAKAAAPGAMGYVAVSQQYTLMAREAFAAEARSWAGIAGGGLTAGDLLAALRPSTAARQIAELLDLPRLAERELRRLSSGEWRRLLIGRALMPDPPLLLVLDEPFDGLDREARQGMTQALAGLIRSGIQIVMATHRPDDLPCGISHLLRVDEGRVAVAGRLEAGARVRGPAAGRPAAPGRPSDPPPFPNAPPLLVELRNVTVGYGRAMILDRLTWRHRRGEHWAVSGPNGAGKTTLLRLIVGDHPQVYANDVRLMGRRRGNGETLQDVRAPIGMIGAELQTVFQRPIKTLEVVLSGFFDSIGLFRRPTPAQTALARQWLAEMELGAALQTDFRHLSCGQQRLVLIARAMIKAPLLLILDEPCEGLDAQHRRQVLARIDALAQRGQTHILYVTHRPEDLPACISHVLHLTPGGGARQETRPKEDGADGNSRSPAADPPAIDDGL